MSDDWALYCAQEAVVEACEKSGVRADAVPRRGGSIGAAAVLRTSPFSPSRQARFGHPARNRTR